MTLAHKPFGLTPHLCSARSFRRLSTFLLAFIGAATYLLAQQVVPFKPDDATQLALKDSLLLRTTSLPLLSPLNAHVLATPRYDYFWLYGDGNFTLGGADSTISHRYKIQASKYDIKTYPTGLYGGGGKPPPKIVSGDVTVTSAANPNPAGHQVTPAVKENRFIRLQKNHLNIVPNDTTMWVLSYKNGYKQGVTMQGELYLFFNSPIERVLLSRNGDTTILVSNIGGNDQYGSFKNDTTFFFFPKTLQKTIQLNTASIPGSNQLKNSFKNALLWRFDTLAFGEERHLFIQFKNDENLLSKFPDLEQARVKFLAIMTGDQASALSQEQSAQLNELGITELFTDNGMEYLFGQIFTQLNPTGQSNNPQSFQPSGNIIDMQMLTPGLSKAHDPNQMRVDVCACPPETDGAQKLFCTVDFVNDGYKATENIYVTVHFPEGVDINSISQIPIKIHPTLQAAAINSRVELERNVADNTITWKFINFAIHSVWEYGEGHPMTYGQIMFTALTKVGTNLADIGDIVACIRFDDPNGNPVCTTPVKPTPMMADGSAQSAMAQDALQCDACKSPAGGIPLWLALLIALVILLSLYIVYTES